MKSQEANFSLNKYEQRALGLPDSLTDWPMDRKEELVDLAETMCQGWLTSVTGKVEKPPLKYQSMALWANNLALAVQTLIEVENGTIPQQHIPGSEHRLVTFPHDVERETIAPLLIGE